MWAYATSNQSLFASRACGKFVISPKNYSNSWVWANEEWLHKPEPSFTHLGLNQKLVQYCLYNCPDSNLVVISLFLSLNRCYGT